jgi:hypothetical protein
MTQDQNELVGSRSIVVGVRRQTTAECSWRLFRRKPLQADHLPAGVSRVQGYRGRLSWIGFLFRRVQEQTNKGAAVSETPDREAVPANSLNSAIISLPRFAQA